LGKGRETWHGVAPLGEGIKTGLIWPNDGKLSLPVRGGPGRQNSYKANLGKKKGA